jgi:hypothetical protein
MAYSSGGLIEAIDFNNLAWGTDVGGTYTKASNNLAYLHGIGHGRYGYGQDTTGYTPVALGQVVTATQWTSLVGGVNGALALQGASLIEPASVTAGQTITYYDEVSDGIDTAWDNALTGTVNATTAGTANAQLGFQGWGGGPERRGRYIFTVSWLNGDLARYWWNMGGKLDITASVITGGNTRNTEWSNLCAAMGTIRIGYNSTTKVGGSGVPEILLSTAGTGGYWMDTGAAVTDEHQGVTATHFNQTSPDAPYSVNDINIEVAFGGLKSRGGYPTLTITVDLENDWPSEFQQTVTNAATVTITPRNPVVTALGTAPTPPTITSTFANQ